MTTHAPFAGPLDSRDADAIGAFRRLLDVHGFASAAVPTALGGALRSEFHLRSDLPLYLRRLSGPAPLNTLIKLTGGLFTLVDRRTGLGFYKITFDQILISSVQPAANPGGNVPMESLSLNFTNLEISASDSRGATTNTIMCSMNQNLG